MKKLTTILIGLLLIAPVFAFTNPYHVARIFKNGNIRLGLVEKNPADWSVVDGGAQGLLTGNERHLLFRGVGLESLQKYTLIYYGDATHNDVWPYATCIKEMKTSSNGITGPSHASFDYSGFINNGRNEKFWLVLSSDVDCDAGVFTAWQPSRYLFEWDTV